VISSLGIGAEDKGSFRGSEVGHTRINKVTLDERVQQG
jgi:hypothetical protein